MRLAKHNDCHHQHGSCSSTATFGKIGTKERIYCTRCLSQLAKQKILNKSDYESNTNKCMNPACSNTTKIDFGLRGGSQLMCKACADNEQDPDNLIVNCKNIICAMKDENGKYICKSQKKVLINGIPYCGTHKSQIVDRQESEDEPLNIIHRNTCSFEGCGLTKIIGQFCSKHGDTSLRKNLCRDCHKVRASYSDGVLKYAYCSECHKKRNPTDHKPKVKKEDAKPKAKKTKEPKGGDILKKGNKCITCIELNVESPKYWIYNTQGKPPRYCIDHKTPEMINAMSEKCMHVMNPDDEEKANPDGTANSNIEYCGKQAIFGGKNADDNPRCGEHKLDNQQRTHLKCNTEGCNERRSYGSRDKITGKCKTLYCSNCADKNILVDASHDLCIYQDQQGHYVCDKRATFSLNSGIKAMVCADHRDDTSKDVVHPLCKTCGSRASFGKINGSNKRGPPEYCYQHKSDHYVNVVDPRCVNCHFRPCFYRSTNRSKNKGLCSPCLRQMHPENFIKYNIKQDAIARYLQENDDLNSCIADRKIVIAYDKIAGGGSIRRPDILFKQDTHNVIIEIDERQHMHISYTKEEARILELYYALSELPLIVIRFNPDAYNKILDGETKKYHGLFSICDGKPVINKNVKASYDDTMQELVNTIIGALNTIPENAIDTLYLRYDDHQ